MAEVSLNILNKGEREGTSIKRWRGYLGSTVVHGVFILLAFGLTIPIPHPVRRATERITLVAPVLPEYRVKIAPPVHMRTTPKPVAPVVPPPRPEAPKLLEVAAPKPLPQKPAVVAESVPQSPAPLEVKPELPVTPKPMVQTGLFQQTVEVARNTPAPKLALGGFGYPNAVAPAESARQAAPLTNVGAFDAAGGSRANSDGVDAVKTGGFSDSAAQIHKKAFDANGAQAFTPVEVISKPRPAYTPEARSMRLEGHVSLEVIFLSTGSIRVVRVVHGLGHGLDEAAEQAALQVQFRPAMRGGVPVDTNATIDISFELT